LALIQAAKILSDQKDILNLIWAFHLTTNGSGRHMANSGSAAPACGGVAAARGGARHPQHSGAQFLMGFQPTTSWQCGKIILLTFEQRRVMVTAGDGCLSSSRLRDGDRLLWCLSNDGEGTDGIG
jgi:hypothetical protein